MPPFAHVPDPRETQVELLRDPGDSAFDDGHHREVLGLGEHLRCRSIRARARPTLEVLDVAWHSQAPPYVVRKARRKPPTTLLIRAPVNAIVSFSQRERASSRIALTSSTAFYEDLSTHVDRTVIAPLDEVTKDFGNIIKLLNAKSGTDCREFAQEPSIVEEAMKLVDYMERQGARDVVPKSSVARPRRLRDVERP